jgi:nucleotide-binding universal stress UspA family protein
MMPFKTILFATDFSPTSDVAFHVATALARDYRARVVVLHVIEPSHAGFSEFGGYIGPDEDRADAMARLRAIKAPSEDVAVEHRLMEGDAAFVIVEAAKEMRADLVVMGTMGRHGLTRVVMGSVAEEVLRCAPCPVLTIRGNVAVETPEPSELPEVLAI